MSKKKLFENLEGSSFVDKVAEFGDKISSNVYIQGISQGVMSCLPIIIIGAFASLFVGLPIAAWQNLIASTGIAAALGGVVNATTNMLGLYFTYGIARCLAEKMGASSKIIGLFAIVFYLIMLPAYTMEEGGAYLAFDYLGTRGMILGIVIAFITVKLYKFIIDRNITIKMPAGTPSYVANSFASLIPGFILVIAAMALRLFFALTPYGNAFDMIYQILQIPLTVLIGGNIISNAVISGITQIFWLLGIHPGFIQGMTAPILFGLDGMNQAAFAAGEELPNIIGMAFSYITSTAVFYPAVAMTMFFFSKSDQLKTVAKVAIAPAVFGIAEPMIFGLPVVLNPLLAIPWVITPIINLLVGYLLTSIGLVAHCAGVTVFNFPMIFSGIVNGHFSIALMEIGLFVLDVLIWLPFIKVLDKKHLKEEQAAFDSEEAVQPALAVEAN